MSSKTNVMIRIDSNIAEKAKALDLNLSKLCEAALESAIVEETQPFSIKLSDKIFFRSSVGYLSRKGIISIWFTVTNASDENLILDRITYQLFITKEVLGDVLESFNSAVLTREDIPKGKQVIVAGEAFKISKDTIEKLNEMSSRNERTIGHIVNANIFLNSKKNVIKGKFEWKKDENGFPIIEPFLVI